MTLFSNFRNPNGHSNCDGTFWEPMSGNRFNYLNIGNRLVMKEGLFTERYSVWDELFPEV